MVGQWQTKLELVFVSKMIFWGFESTTWTCWLSWNEKKEYKKEKFWFSHIVFYSKHVHDHEKITKIRENGLFFAKNGLSVPKKITPENFGRDFFSNHAHAYNQICMYLKKFNDFKRLPIYFIKKVTINQKKPV